MIKCIGDLPFLLGHERGAEGSFRFPHFQKPADEISIWVAKDIPLREGDFIKLAAAIVLVSLIEFQDERFDFFFVLVVASNCFAHQREGIDLRAGCMFVGDPIVTSDEGASP